MYKSVFVNEPLQNAYAALENKTYFKIIIGASYTHVKNITDLATIYSLAGAHVIDLAANTEVILAAMEGIRKASELYNENSHIFEYYNEPLIMVSINAGEDPHFRKAVFYQENCTLCRHCIPVCSTSAFKINQDHLIYDETLCYGCGKCIDVCEDQALSMVQKEVPMEYLSNILIPLNIQAVEVHTGDADIETVKNCYNRLPQKILQEGLISFSIESKRFNYKDFLEYADKITSMARVKPLIQVDGIPMSGNSSAKSTLQTIAAAAILLENNVESYIQIAGGTNHLSKSFTDLFGLPIHGIGIGTFARNLVKPYLGQLDDLQTLIQAVNKAHCLVSGKMTDRFS